MSRSVLLEAAQAISIDAEFGGQDLDGDVPAEPRVFRTINLAHPAGAKRRDDLIGAERSPPPTVKHVRRTGEVNSAALMELSHNPLQNFNGNGGPPCGVHCTRQQASHAIAMAMLATSRVDFGRTLLRVNGDYGVSSRITGRHMRRGTRLMV